MRSLATVGVTSAVAAESLKSRAEARVYFERHTSAKSRQVLSLAVPSIFIFCHSSPQACICWRDAAGNGRNALTRFAVGAGGAVGAGAAGTGAAIDGVPGVMALGRSGGRGIKVDRFAFAASSCAKHGPAAIKASNRLTNADKTSGPAGASASPETILPTMSARERRPLMLRSIPRWIKIPLGIGDRDASTA